MKKFTLMTLALLMFGFAQAQEDDKGLAEGDDVTINNQEDTTVITTKKRKYIIIRYGEDSTSIATDTSDSDEDVNVGLGFQGLILGVNGYLNTDNEISMPAGKEFLELDYAKSINVQLNFLQFDVSVVKNYVKFYGGLGAEFNSYQLRNKIALMPDADSVMGVDITDSTWAMRKNRLKAVYLNVPIMLEFNTNENPKKAFHLGVGGFAGVRIHSKTKQVYDLDGRRQKNKVKDDYYLSPFRYGLMAKIGYSRFNLFANYTLNGLFEDGKGPELHPFTVGLMVVGF